MDFKGPRLAASVGPLSVLDDHSRYLIAPAATGTLGGSGATAVGAGLSTVRRSRGHADGSRRALVELAVVLGPDACFAVADAPRHPAVLERHPASPDPGQGGAFSWQLAASPGPARAAGRDPERGWTPIAGSTTKCVPHEALAMQTPASCGGPARGATTSARRAGSIPRCMDIKSGLPGNSRHRRPKMADRQDPGRRTGADPTAGAALSSLLLRHLRPGTRSWDAAFDDRRTLHARNKNYPLMCKGCPETLCKPCPET